MKKIGLLLILAIALVAGGLWFFSPEQQLKRKTNRIIKAFTIEGDESGIASTTGALFLDSLFHDVVHVEAEAIDGLRQLLSLSPSKSIPLAHITSGRQSLPRYCSQFTHKLDAFSYEKIDNKNYHVSFDHSFTIVTKKPLKMTQTADIHTTFVFLKKDKAFKLSKVMFKKQ